MPTLLTLFEIFIFCPIIQLRFPEKIVDFFGWKTRENVVILDFLAVDNFDFTRKIVKKDFGEKLVKMLGICQNWIFGQKFDFSNSVGLHHSGQLELENVALLIENFLIEHLCRKFSHQKTQL